MQQISLSEIIKHFNLQVINQPNNPDESFIYTPNINRCGLPLAGFLVDYNNRRMQIIGRVEGDYLRSLDTRTRHTNLTNFLNAGMPGLIVTNDANLPPDSLDLIKNSNINCYNTQLSCSVFRSEYYTYIKEYFAPRSSVHGVLLELHSEGVLLMGESGIGKSETTLELIKRGYRLVSDDNVDITLNANNQVIGTAPPVIKNLLELRGIGIVDIRTIFGASAVIDSIPITLVIHLKQWENTDTYDRLGLDKTYDELLGIKIPCLHIPVKSGRNLAIIIEVATINNRIKMQGYNAASELNKKLMENMKKDN
ncbi:MAG: HPr(Ser) kinase/phosphatase [Clostridiales bacterium]|jgi:HPr kinase/phosphorylase|nr:HPr(Ser) kinase/phosphatase [Clostridiales bacterium]